MGRQGEPYTLQHAINVRELLMSAAACGAGGAFRCRGQEGAVRRQPLGQGRGGGTEGISSFPAHLRWLRTCFRPTPALRLYRAAPLAARFASTEQSRRSS